MLVPAHHMHVRAAREGAPERTFKLVRVLEELVKAVTCDPDVVHGGCAARALATVKSFWVIGAHIRSQTSPSALALARVSTPRS
jgi:uncharacterized protein (DUF849 family)